MRTVKAMREYNGPAIIRIFGQNLRRLRMRKNISQLSLASRASLTHNFINEVENGRKWISSETLARLATILETDPFQFFVCDPPEMVETGIFEEYMEEMIDSFAKMVNDFRESHLSRAGQQDSAAAPRAD
ncbi:MAG: helix-turn-helix domain-containing protein [Spirochaetaceae bacterium]|nr:helix-turn-helix domain-containing protein [Spirochaetaceae bacterium]